MICEHCGEETKVLLPAPLVRVSASLIDWTLEFEDIPFNNKLDRYDLQPGDTIWWNPNVRHPGDPFEFVRYEDASQLDLILVVPDMDANSTYCPACWDGAVWPDLRQFVINMPEQFRYNPEHPWWKPEWVEAKG